MKLCFLLAQDIAEKEKVLKLYFLKAQATNKQEIKPKNNILYKKEFKK
jgi:hypothetical protein